jgi:NAD(P)-dependent dehydrogenase (short-subunit alcohol dehydrogenase family)
VVTGGAGDIGRAIGAALANDGYEVLLTDLVDKARGKDVAVDTAAIAGRTVDYAQLDVTDRRSLIDRADIDQNQNPNKQTAPNDVPDS